MSKSHSSSSPWPTVSLCQLEAFWFRFADTQHYLLFPSTDAHRSVAKWVDPLDFLLDR